VLDAFAAQKAFPQWRHRRRPWRAATRSRPRPCAPRFSVWDTEPVVVDRRDRAGPACGRGGRSNGCRYDDASAVRQSAGGDRRHRSPCWLDWFDQTRWWVQGVTRRDDVYAPRVARRGAESIHHIRRCPIRNKRIRFERYLLLSKSVQMFLFFVQKNFLDYEQDHRWNHQKKILRNKYMEFTSPRQKHKTVCSTFQ
jgi:hypothetical protein